MRSAAWTHHLETSSLVRDMQSDLQLSSGRRSDVSKRERMLRASTQVNMDDKGRAISGQAGLATRPGTRSAAEVNGTRGDAGTDSAA